MNSLLPPMSSEHDKHKNPFTPRSARLGPFLREAVHPEKDLSRTQSARCKTSRGWEQSKPLIAKPSSKKHLNYGSAHMRFDSSCGESSGKGPYLVPAVQGTIGNSADEGDVSFTRTHSESSMAKSPRIRRVPSSAITRTTSASQQMITRTASAEMAVGFFALAL